MATTSRVGAASTVVGRVSTTAVFLVGDPAATTPGNGAASTVTGRISATAVFLVGDPAATTPGIGAASTVAGQVSATAAFLVGDPAATTPGIGAESTVAGRISIIAAFPIGPPGGIGIVGTALFTGISPPVTTDKYAEGSAKFSVASVTTDKYADGAAELVVTPPPVTTDKYADSPAWSIDTRPPLTTREYADGSAEGRKLGEAAGNGVVFRIADALLGSSALLADGGSILARVRYSVAQSIIGTGTSERGLFGRMMFPYQAGVAVDDSWRV